MKRRKRTNDLRHKKLCDAKHRTKSLTYENQSEKIQPTTRQENKEMTPTGVALKVTGKDGHVSYPSYEAYGWKKISEIIKATYEIDHVADVEITSVNIPNN